MNHRDAEMTEVVVVLDELDDERTLRVVEMLKEKGLEVFKVDNDESVVDGTIESDKVKSLKDVESVRFVRSVLTYTVDYPPGDPRDKDGPEDDDD
jgi:hypothetical protein